MKQTNENPRATTNPGFSKVGFSVDNPQTNKNIAKDNKIAANIFPIILIQSQSTNFIIDPFTEIKLSWVYITMRRINTPDPVDEY